jgi:hypothetical protein
MKFFIFEPSPCGGLHLQGLISMEVFIFKAPWYGGLLSSLLDEGVFVLEAFS